MGSGDESRTVLVRKVKPLGRIAERETAAYAVIKGIDYIVEECPMVEGNTQHRYKEALTQTRGDVARHEAPDVFRFLEEGRAPLRGGRGRPRGRCLLQLRLADACRRDGRARVFVLQDESACGQEEGGARSSRPTCPESDGDDTGRGRGTAGARVRARPPLQAGERVLLIDAKDRRYLVTLADRQAVPLASRDRGS